MWVDCRRDESLRKAGIYRRRPKAGKDLVQDAWVDAELRQVDGSIEVWNVRTGQPFGRVNLQDVPVLRRAMDGFAAKVRGETTFYGSVQGDIVWPADESENVPTVSLWLTLSDPIGMRYEAQ